MVCVSTLEKTYVLLGIMHVVYSMFFFFFHITKIVPFTCYKLLNFIQARVREMRKDGGSNYTAKLMLIGIPNVGKSALANSLHLIGRTSAAGN